MRTYPTSTANRNVPLGVLILAETTAMSGEIVTTYYIDARSNIWRVGDWMNDRPHPVFLFEACRLTGDSEQMLLARWEQKYRATGG